MGDLTLVELQVVNAIVGVLAARVLPAVLAARASARHVQCQGNLKNLALAPHGFHDTNKQFPPVLQNHPTVESVQVRP